MSIGCRSLRIIAILVLLGCTSFAADVIAEVADSSSESSSTGSSATGPVTYDAHIKPIFREKCLSCHNSDDREGELDLSSYAAMFEGGASGAVVEPGDSLNSSLFSLVTHLDEPAMPPEAPKIPADMIVAIKRWINGGALDHSGSKVVKRTSRGLPLELATRATDQPDVPPMPPRLSLEPIVHTVRGDVVRAMAVNPWSPLVALASSKQVLLYDTTSLEPLGVLPFQEGTPEVLRFSRSGALLLAGGGRGGASGNVVVWDVKNGQRVVEVGDELDTVLAADISSDHALIALGGPKRVVRVYSTKDGQLKHELRKHAEWIYDVQFSPDTALLATADRNGSIVIWEAWSGQEYLTIKGHGPGRIKLAWRADSNVLASCGADGAVRLWEVKKGKQVGMWNAHKGGALSVEYTHDGRLVTCGLDRTTKLWSADGKELRAFSKTKSRPLLTAWCDSAGRVLTGEFSGQITVWDAKSGDEVGRLTNNPPTLEMRLASAQKLITRTQRQIVERKQMFAVAMAAVQEAQGKAVAVSGLEDAKRRADAARTMLMLLRGKKRNLDADIIRLEKRVSQIEKGLPTLQDAVRTADRSIRELGGDDEVRKVEQQLRTLARRRLGELRDKKRGLASQRTVRQRLVPEVEKAVATLKIALEALDVIQAAAEPLRAAVLEKRKAVDAAKQAIERNAAEFAAARAAINRWTAEVEFTQTLSKLAERQRLAQENLAVQRGRHETLVAKHMTVKQLLANEVSRLDELTGTSSQTAASREEEVAAAKERIANHREAVAKITRDIKATAELIEYAEAESRRVAEEVRVARRHDGS